MQIILDDKTLCDLECLNLGLFSPLKSFMNEEDWNSVCKNMHLADGSIFSTTSNSWLLIKIKLN